MHEEKNTKGLQAQKLLQEAYTKVEDLDERTNTKQKHRTVGPGSYEEEQFQDKNSKKVKSAGIRKLPEKEAKILKELKCMEWSCPTQTGAGSTQVGPSVRVV